MTTAPNGLVHAADTHKFKRIKPDDQTENPFVKLIPNQDIAIVPSFALESGTVLHNVPVAYKTYGTLSPERDNAMVICHALTGSADVKDWWGPLVGGPGKNGEESRAFDMSRFFIVCMNSPGSPYGSASPVTAKDGNPDNGNYGPEFPLTTIRDDVNLFRVILDDLGVKQIAAVVGGSMGGMLVLEFAYFGKHYVKTIIPIATSARYSAWGISWGEAQRQSIYSDPKYDDGYYPYDDPPKSGLGAARMQALLTYRSRDSFETRFGRHHQDPAQKKQNINDQQRPLDANSEHFATHNEGHRTAGSPRPPSRAGSISSSSPKQPSTISVKDPQFSGCTDVEVETKPSRNPNRNKIPTYYSAQSYLRYQGEKFIGRFDANCYIAITRKLDTHDVSRGRTDKSEPGSPTPEEVREALGLIEQPTLVLGIQSDGLFHYVEQQELAAAIPNSELKTIDSPDGHDGFLLEFKQVNGFLRDFMKRELGHIMSREPVNWPPKEEETSEAKASVFGEAEVEDITAW
ncbi:Homoserine O-acetyltransferase [Fulvia fulva]|uniref:Homoserine O-acetyltransferase n=1 Tax=Passalora fulva TaxID=5499 RepID=A0A9Q8LHY7_PASFU|nr:Homoserine O-acetyltransferase [Fulvia fulva]KAK4623829.1 Homoserine O-acetyltransferase [Fulvia fulva]KAK4625523.1 Homoserine O-acetyltransferase [Fulvia fulva]UJO17797.1 Homoserine O-acetyltransferase [Fulvia fulva]WPV14644.1 Homoserine O-acetyltransferase [Fulvia fulva]WPV30432.1 Homoserine O-acetyltransferase [Fulvia fulva]